METIYAIRVDHIGGYVSRYKIEQTINGCRIIEIRRNKYHEAKFKEKAFLIVAEDEDGTPFEFKSFEGDFSGVEVTNKKPNSDEKEMELMLKMAGYYE